MSRFDFDAWSELAARDPAGYFRERERVIEEFIAGRPEAEQQLRGLQAKIDQVRAVSGTPTIAMRELGQMLGDLLEELASQLQQLDVQADSLHQLIRRRT